MGTDHAPTIRVRVAGLLIDPRRRVLVQRKRGDEWWALPGGRLEHGESLKNCLSREFAEEIGLTVRVLDQVFAGENFFTHKGRTVHSIEFYYRIATETQSSEPPRPLEPDLEFAWLDTANLTSIRPEFIVGILETLLGLDSESNSSLAEDSCV